VAILDIRVLGDPVLRERTDPVASVTDDIRQLVDDLFETMYAAEGIGLAASQVGRRERVAVVDVSESPLVLINPEIVSRQGNARDEEGCLSIPDIYGEVERPDNIVLRALNRDAESFEIEATGLLARCIQHEVDHLEGRLFIDYLSILKRRIVARKWEREVDKYLGFIRKIVPGQSTDRKSRSRTQTALQRDPDPEL
jgi:peptide deformylase